MLEDFPYPGQNTKIVKLTKPLPLFIRFGHFQSETNERSLNWSTGEYERGISVYPAQLKYGKVYVADDWLHEVQGSWDVFCERTQYVLTGRYNTTGSDGEPVLIPSSIVVRGIKGPGGAYAYGLELAELADHEEQ